MSEERDPFELEDQLASFLAEEGDSGATIAEVAGALGISPREGEKLLEELRQAGEVERVGLELPARFRLKH